MDGPVLATTQRSTGLEQRAQSDSKVTPAIDQARRRQLGAGLLLVLLALLLYAATLDNGLQPGELLGGDLITHQYAQVQARPSNAPGYPLYTMGGWLWFHTVRDGLQLLGVQNPNPIPILASYSTLWALAALWLLYGLLCRITRSARHPAGNWPLAWLLACFYAVTYFFWYYATTTEQYSSAIAQTLAIVYVYLLWRDSVHQPKAGGHPRFGLSRADQLLLLLALLCGLSLAHMLTVAFIVPPLVIAVLWEDPRLLRSPRLIALAVVAAFLPLLSYVYVYIRGSAHPEWWGEGSWGSAQEWFWSFVSTAQGREELSWGFQPSCAFFDNGFPALIWQELSVPLLVLGLAGTAWLGRRLAFVLYGTLAIYLVFDWMYRCGNWYQVILPAYPLLLLGAAAVLDRWQQRFSARFAGQTEARAQLPTARAALRWLAYLPHIALFIAVIWRGAASWTDANSRNRPGDTALERAALLLDQPLPRGAGLFAPVNDALALDYLINIWGLRPDLRVVSSDQAGDLLRNQGVVLTTFDAAEVLLEELPGDLQPVHQALSADWLRLGLTAADSPAPAVRVDQALAPGVLLQGYTVTAAPGGAPVRQPERAADVMLVWSVEGAWPAELGISLRPLHGGAFIPAPGGPEGAIIQQDAAAPVHGFAPVAAGSQAIVDVYRVPLPPGADGLLLIVYRREGDGFTNLLELPLRLESVVGRP